MNNSAAIRLLVLGISSIMLTACVASGYTTFYKPIGDSPDPNLLSQSDGVDIYAYGPNADTDDRNLLRDGFIPIGYASFNGALESEDEIYKQAKKVGAHVALVKQTHTGTNSGVLSLPIYNAGQMVTSRSSGTATVRSPYGTSTGTYTGTTVTQLPGSTSYVPVPYSVSVYDQYATFWVEMSPSYWACGIHAADLSPDQRKIVGKNQGVLVDIVVKRTAAFRANVFEGDILLSVNSEPVFDINSMRALCLKYKGNEISLEVLRDGKELTLVAKRT
jgi:hypothetical protein